MRNIYRGTVKKTIMKLSFLQISFLLCHGLSAQVSVAKLSLPYGKYDVGFKHFIQYDNTRTYERLSDWNKKATPRPISTSIWFPTQRKIRIAQMTVEDYMVILKEEEEWEVLPNERILDWFYYSNSADNKIRLREKVKAVKNEKPLPGKFPVVVYAPSYQASSVENFALCEFLASHGFVVISSPSRGTVNRFLEGGTTRDIETQARDIQFLIGEITNQPYADVNNLAVMGFSFGGISNVLAQMKDKRIKAIVCLDGSIKYQLPKIQSSPYFDLSAVDVPFVFMSQKDIPIEVMKEDKIDSTLNTKFDFYDSLKYSKAYHLKFNNMTHAYFSSLGVLFQDRDTRQDKSDNEISDSYKWVNIYTLNFLNAFLNNQKKGQIFLENLPVDNGVIGEIISKKSKEPIKKSFSFEDFNLLAIKSNYNDLYTLYKKTEKEHPLFKLEEWKANTLGLILVFKNKIQEGINILLLNIAIFPESANAYDSLGEAYLIAGDKKNATEAFNKSLKFDPQNQNAINRLKQLGN
jgi:dienelactone hydrolase